MRLNCSTNDTEVLCVLLLRLGYSATKSHVIVMLCGDIVPFPSHRFYVAIIFFNIFTTYFSLLKFEISRADFI